MSITPLFGVVFPVGLCFVDAAADYPLFFSTPASDELPDFMNGPVKNMLGIIPPEVTWRTCKLFAVVFVLCKTGQRHKRRNRGRERLAASYTRK